MSTTTSRRLAATVVRNFPVDEVLDGKSKSTEFMKLTICEVSLVDGGNPCSVVDGMSTIFTDGSDVDGDAVSSGITTAVNNEEFNEAHVDIVKVVIVFIMVLQTILVRILAIKLALVLDWVLMFTLISPQVSCWLAETIPMSMRTLPL